MDGSCRPATDLSAGARRVGGAQVVEFYGLCSHANNYATREAACICLAELAERLDPAAVQPFLPSVLRLLLSLLRDDSWPVGPPTHRCTRAVVRGELLGCQARLVKQAGRTGGHACTMSGAAAARQRMCRLQDPVDLRWSARRCPTHCLAPAAFWSGRAPRPAVVTWHGCLQVRASACLASGQTVRAHPEAARGALPRLHATWARLLDDNVFSVREGAAVALGHSAAAYGGQQLDLVLALLGFARA